MGKLHTQTLILGAVAAVLAALAVNVGLSWQPEQQARQGFEQHARSLAQVLATTVQPSVAFDDKDALARDITVAQVDASVAGAVVRTAQGAVMAGFNPARVPDAADLRGEKLMARDIGDVHVVAIPLPVSGKTGHWLMMATSLDSLRASLESSRRAALLVALLVGLGGLVAAFVTARNVAGRREIFAELTRSMAKLRGFSKDLATISSDQASSTAEQRAAVEETRRTMEALLESARRIADASQQVFGNAEKTSKMTTNVSEATKGLVSHAQRIGEISETIRAIADRSDLLALNAALEGTKAGEAGRGFSLVAVEMRRLAENTMGAVREIKQLVTDIRVSSTNSVTATDEGARLAQQTNESAHEITVVTQQQRSATEQVAQSMDEVRQTLEHSSESVRRATAVSADLVLLADQLGKLTQQISDKTAGA